MTDKIPTPETDAFDVNIDMQDLSIGHKLSEWKRHARSLETRLARLVGAVNEFREHALYPGDCQCHEFSTEKKMKYITAQKALVEALKEAGGV